MLKKRKKAKKKTNKQTKTNKQEQNGGKRNGKHAEELTERNPTVSETEEVWDFDGGLEPIGQVRRIGKRIVNYEVDRLTRIVFIFVNGFQQF